MRVFGLVGYPLSHSFSKKYFEEKFAGEHISDCIYQNFEVPDISGLRKSMDSLTGMEGFNITIPYKEKILGLLNESNEIVRQIKACNCIKITQGRWIGHNTDVIAFKKSFTEKLKSHHSKALVLGTGGASKAVAYVLNQLGIEILFVSTTKIGEGFIAYTDLNNDILNSHQLIINTTPVGTFPAVSNSPGINYEALSSSHYLYDLVYNPAKTQFLSLGEKQGAQIKNGHEMLILQAEESWKIWNTDNN